MKPLHLIAGKDISKSRFMDIVVKDGFVHVTNGWALLKMPTQEVFGDVKFEEDEVLIFEASKWALLKFHTSKRIVREGLKFKNLTADTEMVARTPKEAGYQILDYDSQLPSLDKPVVPVTWASFDPSKMIDLVKAFGTKDFDEFKFQFYGDRSCIEVLHKDFSTTSAILMPTINETPVKEYEFVMGSPIEVVKEKTEPVERNIPSNPVALPSDNVIDSILDLLKKHTETRKAILDDYALGDEDCRMELAVADDNLLEDIAEIEIEDSYSDLLQKVKDHSEFNSQDLLEHIVKEEGEITLHNNLTYRGYAIIKIDNILQQSKLEDFVKAEIWPLYADQDKYSI